jgi:DNA-directed RNA polymerase subunit L
VNVVGYDVEHEVETPSGTRRRCARTSIRQKARKAAKRTIENYGMLQVYSPHSAPGMVRRFG